MKTILIPLLTFCILLSSLFLRAGESGDSTRISTLHETPDILFTNTEMADPLDIAMEYIHAHLGEWGLTPQDITGMTVNDMYKDKTSGITRIYFQQRHRGIPVYHAILNVNITREGKVFFTGNRFVDHLTDKVNTIVPVLSTSDAVMNLADHLGLPHEELRLKRQEGESEFVFEKGGLAQEDISAVLSYQPYQDQVLLAWDILFSPLNTHDRWSTRVDAVTGNILNENNWTVRCETDGGSFGSEDTCCLNLSNTSPSDSRAPMTGAQYNVWPAPFENPKDGPRTIVTDPFDPTASPFGWHDIDGQPGAEYTITRGNNTWVFQDRDDDGYSEQDEPDGGPELHFDSPFNPSWEPEQYTSASAINLFYGINSMHDFAYRFGFDEAAGNFQINTYGNGGAGNDFIYGIVQAGADVGAMNEAFYRHNVDGKPGVIFTMEYQRIAKFLTVNEPAALAGQYVTGIPGSGWGAGAYVSEVPVTGEVVIVNDGIEESSASDACEEILNASELAGKIAFIDRGSCEMSIKVLHAQTAGAIGVIICNSNYEFFRVLTPGMFGSQVHIPVVLINATEGAAIRQYAGNGLKVSLVNPGQRVPGSFDIALDNGAIAHEYGHGITWRLVGGPDLACMENAENMDEGWSDFFALVTTVKPGDEIGSRAGTIGTYLTEEPSTGRGRRRYPYSPDMDINPLTYGDVALSYKVHHVGETWATVLWDMYWALVDTYGWSADLYDPSSGNYKAIRLVFDGLKNTACNPGYVDGRDAILAADEALFNGENRCLLWEVFARRGLGYSADQGSSFYLGDEKEAFDVPPLCTNSLMIEKSVTDFIQPGDDIHVTLTVGNYKQETATNVVVTDEIPAGTSFKPGSANFPVDIQGGIVAFNLGDMSFTEEKTITYTLQSSSSAWSLRKFLDEVSDETDDIWHAYSIIDVASNSWMVTDAYPAHSGQHAWYIMEISGYSREALELNPDEFSFHVEGDRPVLRFYHRYDTHAAINGGVIDVREVGTSAWIPVGKEMLRNGYPGYVDYLTFTMPDIQGFSGNSGEDYQATYVDLSKWIGKDLQIRFRFGTVANSESHTGWLIDDIEFMDMLAYNGEACVTSDQGDFECAVAPEAGTIVESKAEIPSAIDEIPELSLRIYPNPATDNVTIALAGDHEQEIHLSLLTMDGRLLFERSLDLSGNDLLHINTSNVPAGIYLINGTTTNSQFIEKVIIEK